MTRQRQVRTVSKKTTRPFKFGLKFEDVGKSTIIRSTKAFDAHKFRSALAYGKANPGAVVEVGENEPIEKALKRLKNWGTGKGAQNPKSYRQRRGGVRVKQSNGKNKTSQFKPKNRLKLF